MPPLTPCATDRFAAQPTVRFARGHSQVRAGEISLDLTETMAQLHATSTWSPLHSCEPPSRRVAAPHQNGFCHHARGCSLSGVPYNHHVKRQRLRLGLVAIAVAAFIVALGGCGSEFEGQRTPPKSPRSSRMCGSLWHRLAERAS